MRRAAPIMIPIALAILAGCSLGPSTGPDTSEPLIRIDSPVAQDTVGSNVNIAVTAVDDVGVDSVRILIDGALLVREFSPPYIAAWNTQGVTNNANHTIRAEAFDRAGNKGVDQITVWVLRGPQ